MLNSKTYPSVPNSVSAITTKRTEAEIKAKLCTLIHA